MRLLSLELQLMDHLLVMMLYMYILMKLMVLYPFLKLYLHLELIDYILLVLLLKLLLTQMLVLHLNMLLVCKLECQVALSRCVRFSVGKDIRSLVCPSDIQVLHHKLNKSYQDLIKRPLLPRYEAK